jgi:hypothetical protein
MPGETRFGQLYLASGCNNVSITRPGTTPIAELAGMVRPTGIVASIWKYDAEHQRFLGYAPAGGTANDLVTVQRLDAIYLCTTRLASWRQPLE